MSCPRVKRRHRHSYRLMNTFLSLSHVVLRNNNTSDYYANNESSESKHLAQIICQGLVETQVLLHLFRSVFIPLPTNVMI